MLIRGADNYAGEVGYLDLNCDHPYPYGRLEPVASGGRLIEQALSLLDTYPDSALHKAKQENALHSARIFKEAQNGDKLAQMLAARAVRFPFGRGLRPACYFQSRYRCIRRRRIEITGIYGSAVCTNSARLCAGDLQGAFNSSVFPS